jgi:hypothetical protein
MATAAMALTIGAVSAAAAGTPTNCDSGHGAFGAFAHDPGAVHQLVLADKAEGTSLGAETGPDNSGFSEFCNG